MKTRIDLSKYENMYDTFDIGHDRDHMEGVREFAVTLAEKYCPEKLEIVYVSATLHDIGLSASRDQHEKYGYELVRKDQTLKSVYSEEDFNFILEAIREHRASSGNPQSTVAKIVSDADKAYSDTYGLLNRSYKYEKARNPSLDMYEVLEIASSYLTLKFGEDGTGKRLYFEESKQRMEQEYEPIVKAYKNGDYEYLKKVLSQS